MRVRPATIIRTNIFMQVTLRWAGRALQITFGIHTGIARHFMVEWCNGFMGHILLNQQPIE
jgi:hypothetical protein